MKKLKLYAVRRKGTKDGIPYGCKHSDCDAKAIFYTRTIAEKYIKTFSNPKNWEVIILSLNL